MKKFIAALATCAMSIPAIASATALDDAREANICDVTAAEYLADGRLKVVCVPGTVNPAYAGAVQTPAAFGAGSLSPTAIAAVAGAVILIAIVANDDDTTTTTTTAPSSP
ncbi:hypothetical protein [Falsiruegeria mediterranea]|jgi:hypothetical protein|uniref:Uncharacterized protein n=1 Tax=Falsiruegeria mediterranea M17 TaxID=1200281 RepID=A0A2R8CFV0_9RHOB|nr:hypothetical protein [Falsiruegeria mediterranea]SPJ31300.1 hypothetical protein TRM7615_04843 [Falsiruegeria mediterranea M17]